MRRCILLGLFALMLFALPVGAGAATNVTLENLTIQLWPDYDRLAVLVIYDFLPDANTALPVTVSFQMPSNAELVAVAKNSNGALLTVEHELPVPQGNNSVVTFTLSEKTVYHLEYYLPYTQAGKVRNFVFTWPGDYAVKALSVALQKPSAATNIITDPVLTEIVPDKSGFAYQSIAVNNLAAQEIFTLTVRYQNENDTLTASTLSVQPSAPLTENVPGQVSLTAYLPWVLAGLALVLIVGGIGWYWYSSRGSASPAKGRRRKPVRQETPRDEGNDAQVYCHQCGKRARSDDRFCRTCGAQLRQGES